MSEAQEILSVTVDDSAAQAGLKRIGDGLDAVAKKAGAAGEAVDGFKTSTDAANDTTTKTVPRLREVDGEYERLLKRIPGTTEALAKFNQIQARASADLASGRISAAAYAQVLDTMSAKYVNAAKATTQASAAMEAANRSTGNWRTAMQQAGYQAGDFFTQVSMGGNAVTAFTVQFGQLAGAFGPAGAVIGAVATVVGVLAMSLGGVKTAAEAAKDAQDALSRVMSESAGSVEELTAKYKSLSDAQRVFERINVTTALAKQTDALNAYKTDVLGVFKEIDTYTTQTENVLRNSNWSIGGGATDEEIRLSQATLKMATAFKDFRKTGDVVALANDLTALRGEAYDLGFNLDDMLQRFIPIATKAKDTAEAVDRLRSALKALSGDTSAASGALKDQEKTIDAARKSLDDRAKLYGAEAAALRGNAGALDAYNREKVRAEEYAKSYADAVKTGVGETDAAAKATEMAGKAVEVFNQKLAASAAQKADGKATRAAEAEAKAYQTVVDKLGAEVVGQEAKAKAVLGGAAAVAEANIHEQTALALIQAKTKAGTEEAKVIEDLIRRRAEAAKIEGENKTIKDLEARSKLLEEQYSLFQQMNTSSDEALALLKAQDEWAKRYGETTSDNYRKFISLTDQTFLLQQQIERAGDAWVSIDDEAGDAFAAAVREIVE